MMKAAIYRLYTLEAGSLRMDPREAVVDSLTRSVELYNAILAEIAGEKGGDDGTDCWF